MRFAITSLFTALFLLCVSVAATASPRASRDSVQTILKELDEAIAQKESYMAHKALRIQELKSRVAYMSDSVAQYGLYKELFNEYLHYQADSAVYFLNCRVRLLPQPGIAGAEAKASIDRAAVMGVMGMYGDAVRELESVNSATLDPDMRMEYFHAFRSCYGWLADYTVEPRMKQKYMQMTDRYRDSIRTYALRGLDRDLVVAEKKVLAGQPDEAIRILQGLLDDTDDMEILSYLNYTMFEAWQVKNDVDRQIYYLAVTALWDIRRAVREYASLHKLARLLYERGDVDRAYMYLNLSMADAVACNARLRSLEVTEVYPIINRAYKEKESHERAVVTWLLAGISLLALSLIVAVFYLYYWMKKLAAMRRELYLANKQLQAANKSLAETGKMKDVYIAHYLDRCVSSMEKLEQYRISLEKLAMTSKIETLFKTIKSDGFLREERKAFYRDFDHSVLELFPHFVDDFNNLLVESGRISVKPGEALTTELRIFALIRLGVTDTNSIARFLGYSLATIYSYRSKLRNKAKGDKDKFEQEVMNL